MQVLLDARERLGVRLGSRSRPTTWSTASPAGWSQRPVDAGSSWSNNRTCRGRIQTASGSAGSGRAGQVGAGGVAEVAEPLVARAAAELVSSTAKTSSPTTVAVPPECRGPRAAPRVVGQRHVVVLEPADDRAPTGPLARTAAVEPEAPRGARRRRPEERGRVARASVMPSPGSSRPARRRARTGSTRGGTARPRAAATGGARPSPRRPRSTPSPPARRAATTAASEW